MTDLTRPRPNPAVHRRVLDVLGRFDQAMLVTLTPEGVLRSRPMLVAGHDDDGTVWFITGAHSGKVDEVALFERATAVFQAPRLYLNLSGEAHVVDDRDKLRDLWREGWRVWFPTGPNDDTLTLLKLSPHTADLWDMRGTRLLQNLADAVATWLGRGSSEAHVALQHQHTAM